MKLVSALGWLAFVLFAVMHVGCSGLPGNLPDVPKVEASDARAAYKMALAACIVCAVPVSQGGATSHLADGCAELVPVCDALAGICK